MNRLRPVQWAISVAAGVVVLVWLVGGGRMFSPGALSPENRSGKTVGGVTAHADLAGNCSACHAPAWSRSTMADRCLACHTDVRQQMTSGSVLHGKIESAIACFACHTEHHGSHERLTNLGSFDHGWTAFPLTGHHTRLECAACHKDIHYKNVAQTCVGCHAEPKSHLGQFGTNCASCHSTTHWKGAVVAFLADGSGRFDHDRTAFKLTGKHRDTDCKACHVNNAFKGTPQTCASCHQMPKVPTVHRVNYGPNCAGCHTTLTFKEPAFKHAFPIDHHSKGTKGSKIVAGNVCANCHNNPRDMTTYDCTNCHAHELTRMQRRHSARMLGNVKLEQCTKCHTGRRHRMAADEDGFDDVFLAWLRGGRELELFCPLAVNE